MKINYLKFLAFFLLFSLTINAQKAPLSRPILMFRGIGTYHDLKSLEAMNKGELKELYLERLKILVNVIPYYAISTKAGTTMKDMGITESVENLKVLERESINRDNYLLANVDFLNAMIPYCDKINIIQGILFYEDLLKKIHSGGDE